MGQARVTSLWSRRRMMLFGYIGLSIMTGALLFMGNLDHAASFQRWLVMCGGLAIAILVITGLLEGFLAVGFDLDTLSEGYTGPKEGLIVRISKRIVGFSLKLSILAMWGWLFLAIHDLAYDEILPYLLIAAIIMPVIIGLDEIRLCVLESKGKNPAV